MGLVFNASDVETKDSRHDLASCTRRVLTKVRFPSGKGPISMDLVCSKDLQRRNYVLIQSVLSQSAFCEHELSHTMLILIWFRFINRSYS